MKMGSVLVQNFFKLDFRKYSRQLGSWATAELLLQNFS